LTIEAATDVSFMRPFIEAFQAEHPQVAVQYVDSQTYELLARARAACRATAATPDMYISIATDHLVELANSGCAAPAPKKVAAQAPAWAQWRREVIAFSLEPAVFVYDTRRFTRATIPRTHLALVEALRLEPDRWRGRIGTYDIEQSGPGYNYANFDARQAAIYGRLIESFGRSQVRTYCCSNVMVEAVRSGEILLAYNVQLSYAYAAQRESRHVGVVLPSDYQAIQARSAMISRDARNPSDATDFLAFLTSPRGKSIAAGHLAAAPRGETIGVLSETERAAQVSVNAAQLVLRDPARRASFIREWRRAIRPPADADT
jgi:iron(III) transport system substrate-binding protein